MANWLKEWWLFDWLDEWKKKELATRIMDMDSNWVGLPRMQNILQDIIEWDLPSKINDENHPNNNEDQVFVDKFIAQSQENKDYVEDLVFQWHSAEEIVLILKWVHEWSDSIN